MPRNSVQLKRRWAAIGTIVLTRNMLRFRNEMRDHVYLQRVQEHIALGNHLRLRATPTFFMNGTLVDVSYGLGSLEKAVELALSGN